MLENLVENLVHNSIVPNLRSSDYKVYIMNHPALGSSLWSSPRRSKTKTIIEASVLSKDKMWDGVATSDRKVSPGGRWKEARIPGCNLPDSNGTKLGFLYISLLRTLQSSPPRVDPTVWKPLSLKGLHRLSHTVSSFFFWRVREDEGKLFKDPYKGQFEVLFTTCINDSKMILL